MYQMKKIQWRKSQCNSILLFFLAIHSNFVYRRISKSREKKPLNSSRDRRQKWKSKLLKEQKEMSSDNSKSDRFLNTEYSKQTPDKSLLFSSSNQKHQSQSEFKNLEYEQTEEDDDQTPKFKTNRDSEEEINTIIKFNREASKDRIEEIDEILK